MPASTKRLYIWCGLVSMVLVFSGLLVARALPLPRPDESAVQIAAFFAHQTTAIRLGVLIMMFGGALLGPWTAAIASELRKIEGPGSPAAYCQLALGSLLVLEIILPCMLLEVAAFRPNRPPDEILTLSDESWILLVGLVFTFIVEAIALGLTILNDRREQPVFPRWAGAVSVVAALGNVLGALVVLSKRGPLAWNGLLGFWLPAFLFVAWLIALTWLMLDATDSDEPNLTSIVTSRGDG